MAKTIDRMLGGAALWTIALAAPAHAQEAPPPETPPSEEAPQDGAAVADEIVITGIRGTISRAIEIKRESINVVDSITTEDLGKLPDQNVAESLQRLPGVTIERNRGDGQFISVRGLGPDFNAVTVNGRTLATDNAGRRFSFDILPSELIAGADIYKSPMASLNGASIGATVNIKTIRPLDQRETVITGSVRGIYNELAESISPSMSGLVSWRNDDRTFGVALAASYVDRDIRSDEFTIGAGHVKRSSTEGGYFEGRIGPEVEPFENVDMPSNLSPFFVERESERLGLNGTVQWKPVDTVTLTVDGLYSKLDQLDVYTGLAYDFAGGTLVEQVVEDGAAVYQRIEGGFVDEIIQQTPRRSDTYQIGGNLAWEDGPAKIAFDASYSNSRINGRDDNYFTTIRRTGMTMEWDRRTGSPIYDYDFSSPDYPNAPIDTENIGAHYMIVGGTKREDETLEFKLDTQYDFGNGIIAYLGIGRQDRNKITDTTSQGFSGQCAFCGGEIYKPLPSSLFRPTDKYFFAKHDGDIIRDWIEYDPAEMIQTLREYRTPDGESLFVEPTYDPAQSSVVTEDVWIAYGMLDMKQDLFGRPLAVNVGVRVEDTKFTSSGASRTVISARPNNLGQNIIEVSDVVPVSFEGHYTDVLPSVNVRYDLTDRLVARFAASRVMTRPELTDLSPRMSIQTNPGNETIRRGNPDLQPFRASQAEIGLEWYFQDLGLLTAVAFYKDIDSFVTLRTTPQMVDQVLFQVTEPVNGEGATVKGLEFGYRQAFDFLPGIWSGFGAEASYTYVDSSARYENDVTGVTYGLEGLSKNSYTLVGFYEKGPVQARVAYTWRDRFLQVANGRNGDPEYFDAYGQLDASLSFAVTDFLTASVEALNLTDSNEFIYSTTPDRTKEFRTTGRRLTFGLRARF